MKRLLLLTFICLFGWTLAKAQLPNGSIAPDFTGIDLDGNAHNLYDLLNAGKTVYLDMSATWCGPCWNYHNTHAFKTIWDTYGPDGTDEAYVMFIEGDASTNTACLYGPSGCVGGTQGNWVNGTPYPIIDDASIANLYQISYYPTIYCICPADKKVYECGQLSATGLWNYRNTHCGPPAVNYALTSTKNVKCYNTNTGAINITPSGGIGTFTYHWSNGATTQDLNNIPAGTYTVTITSGTVSQVSDPIEILQPSEALGGQMIDIQPVGCNGILGGLTISPQGGWSSQYTYAWQNGQSNETVTNLNSGLHKVTITDAEGCTAVVSYTLAPPVYPTVLIETPEQITCLHPTIVLDATGSTGGDELSFQWFASNGGHIVSDDVTPNPVVDGIGVYSVQVTNTATTCSSIKPVTVSGNIAQPTANAGTGGTVSCPSPTLSLSGSGSGNGDLSYLWTGGNVVSGATTLTPVVGAPGVYTLAVTDNSNGCSKTSTTTVTGFNTPPTINTASGTLTCAASSITLTTTTNTGNPTYAWTGPNGYSSTLQSPVVAVSGSYQVLVNDTITGCSNTATANVTSSTAGPGVTATGGALTCVINSVNIVGVTADTNATYAWTGPNGFTSELASFTSDVEGVYNLVVTDPDNGCTSLAAATLANNAIAPAASAVSPSNLNCHTTQVQLNGTGSAQGNNISYAWSTANGHIVSGESTQTPVVDAVGTYHLLVSNSDNGCTATTSTDIAQSAVVTASLGTQSNVSCFGGTSGTASVQGGGGNGVYSYAWSNGATTASVSDLAAGTYVVVLTDGENCSASVSVSITQPDLLAVNATTTAQSANGIDDGTATANPNGGTATYSYNWSNNETTQSIEGLAPGTYTVTVTDQNGCTAVQNVTVNSFNCALSASVSGTNISCFGAANGTATVSYIGGAEPLSFAWSNGATTQTVENLPGGSYTVNVTDANNCPAVLNVSIVEPLQLSANASATSETAAGTNDGTATANPTGGAGTYTYLWSNNATTQTITGLASGSYTVEVTDTHGCVSTQTVFVSSFSCAISGTNTVNNISCAGAANGSIVVIMTAGEAPFTFTWSNGSTGSSISGLSAGTYTAVIVDANFCETQSTAVITEPDPFSSWNVDVVSPVCANEASGSAVANISGATAPYTFVWNNGSTGNSISNVIAGTYTVQATDAHGCTSVSTVNIASSDTEAPTVSAQDAEVSLDNSGNVVLKLTDINAQFADNCGVATTVISPNTFSCTQLGQHTVTLTVTDLNGLNSVTSVTVMVRDKEAPVVTCPGNMQVCSYDNIVNYAPATAQDNCLLTQGQWAQTSGLPIGAEFPAGTTTQTFTYTDPSGNVGSCSFSVTVKPEVLFDNVAVKDDQNGTAAGLIDITVSGGTAPYTFSWSNEAGEVFATTEDVSGLTQGTYEVVVTDAEGCTYTQGGIVVNNTVATKEPNWLSGVSLQPNPTRELTNIIFAAPIDASLEIALIDATGRVVKTQISEQQKVITLDCSELPGGMYTVRFRSNQEIGTRKLIVVK